MSLISLYNASLAFGDKPLLDKVSLTIDSGNRLGLIGRNGCGKSTLIKVLAGLHGLDDGEIKQAQGLVLAYIAQEHDFDKDKTIFEIVSQGLDVLHQQFALYEKAQEQLAQHPEDKTAFANLNQAQSYIDKVQGWQWENQVASILEQMGLLGDQKIANLSGGWKKRVAIAQALVKKPEVILLDEPTNHLDLASIEWLEGILQGFKGAFLVITHDRSFLNNVVENILELDRGILRTFPGNYTEYKKRKAEILQAEETANAQFDKFLAQEEVWIRKGVEARRTRNMGRVKRLENLREQRAERRELFGQVSLQVDTGKRSGKIVSEAKNISYRLPNNRWLIKDFSTIIQRGDKVGFIGPNGAGKTTLLKLLLGEIQPSTGAIYSGTNLSVAYLDQTRSALKPELSIIDNLRGDGGDFIEIGEERIHVMTYLTQFLFAPHRVNAKVKSLSGGERARLLLAKLFARPSNIIVLDEPTNDLDLDTLEVLEDLLLNYTGTVLLVSHDRAFVDNIVTQSIVATDKGQWINVAGGYDEWYKERAKIAPEIKPTKTEKPEVKKEKKVKKLSYKEQKELSNLPAKIEKLEQKQAQVQEELAKPETYQDNEKVMALNEALQEIEENLMELYARWEALEN